MSSKRELALIIPAAGSGTRLGTTTPKPYLEVAGRTILEHTLRQFASLEPLAEVVVSTSAGYMEQTREMLLRVFSDHKISVVEGGAERQHSIRNALDVLGKSIRYVAVHDAVRPFVREDQILACYRRSVESGAAIMAVRAKDTIKVSGDEREIRQTPDRSLLWQAQTPQIFRTDLLQRAYHRAVEEGVLGTDDASLVEQLGEKVFLVEGDRENFKITYPLDLKLAEWIIHQKRK
jgi:2-C-methyl-D-erythritol 4-phosphate cytidylyltransferase